MCPGVLIALNLIFSNILDPSLKFNPLNKDTQLLIVNKMLKELNMRLIAQGLDIYFADSLKKWILDESFDSINRAISGFVTDYNNLKDKVSDKEDKIKDLEDKVRKLNAENEKITEENSSLHSRQSEYRQENNELKSDNNKLNSEIKKLNMENEKINSRMKLLEDKLIKTAALLNKVYNGIHRD